MKELFKMAWRGLVRNRRRSFLSALALGVGVALLLFMASFIEGEMRSSLELSIRLESGHLQVRAKDYKQTASSLAWEDLVSGPQLIASQIAAMPQVQAASPRLFIGAIMLVGDESLGVRVIGIDPAAKTNEAYREHLAAGAWLAADDREGVLIGQAMAVKRGLGVGDAVTLLVNTSNGEVDQQSFVVRGIYDTNTPSYDRTTILMPLVKAQAISQAGDHASVIWVQLYDALQVEQVAAALITSEYEVVTYEDLNPLMIMMKDLTGVMMAFFYLIVLAITATVVINAMVMAVFERTREIGILAAIGMKARRIRALFLAESFLIACGGVIIGMVLGGIGVYFFTTRGIYLGSLVADMGVDGFLMGDRLYGYLTLRDAITLVIAAFAVTLVGSLYPAGMASNMEPVQALHGGEA